MAKRTCSVDGCKRPARSNQADWCNTHYFRWYRTGDVGEAEIATYRRGPRPCAIEECGNVIPNGTYCPKHYARLQRTGDPLGLTGPRVLTGPAHPHWKGHEAGYGAIHSRLRSHRGPAVQCERCDSKGPFHWALNWDGDIAVRKDSETGLPYSTDINDYIMLCVSCHKIMDMARHRPDSGADRFESAPAEGRG